MLLHVTASARRSHTSKPAFRPTRFTSPTRPAAMSHRPASPTRSRTFHAAGSGASCGQPCPSSWPWSCSSARPVSWSRTAARPATRWTSRWRHNCAMWGDRHRSERPHNGDADWRSAPFADDFPSRQETWDALRRVRKNEFVLSHRISWWVCSSSSRWDDDENTV